MVAVFQAILKVTGPAENQAEGPILRCRSERSVDPALAGDAGINGIVNSSGDFIKCNIAPGGRNSIRFLSQGKSEFSAEKTVFGSFTWTLEP